MSDAETLRGLLARVRAATGEDLRLSMSLCCAFGIAPWLGEPPDRVEWCMPRSKMALATPSLTGDTGAALAAVEHTLPGWSWEVRRSGFGTPAQAILHDPMKQPAPGYDTRVDHPSGSPALALCAALLTTLIAQIGESRHAE